MARSRSASTASMSARPHPRISQAPPRRAGRPDLRPAQRMGDAAAGDRRGRRRPQRHSALARPRHARPVQEARRVARRDLRERLREGAGGVWRIKSLHLYVNFVAPYEKGWARLKPGEGLVQSQASKDFPPDRPPTRDLQALPRSRRCRRSTAPNPVDRQAGDSGGRDERATASSPQPLLLALAASPCLRAGRRRPRSPPIKQRVELLEDQDAIENLEADLRLLFRQGPVERRRRSVHRQTGSFEYGQRGVYVGQERIQPRDAAVRAAGPRPAASQQPHAAAGDHRRSRPTARRRPAAGRAW